MKLSITESIAKDIIAGASIFSTGGGFEYSAQLKKLPEIFAKNRKIELLSVDELSDYDYVCTAYGVGSASNTDVDLSKALAKGFEVMKSITQKKFKGIFAGETNIEALVFQTSRAAGLPVIDADCTGGRAVPEIQFDNLFVAGKNIVPLVAVTMKGEVAVLMEAASPVFIEQFVRNIAVITGDSVAVIDHPMSVRDAKKYLTLGIFERSRKIGKIIRSEEVSLRKKIDFIIKQTSAKKIIDGVVSEISLNSEKGFLEGTVTIQSDDNSQSVIHIKNESLVCELNKKVIVTIPDLITIIDAETGFGVHNSKIKKGQRVTVIGIPASGLWRSKAGVSRFNPRKMRLPFKTKLI